MQGARLAQVCYNILRPTVKLVYGVTAGPVTQALTCPLFASYSLNENALRAEGAVELAKALPECKALVSLRCVLSFLCHV